MRSRTTGSNTSITRRKFLKYSGLLAGTLAVSAKLRASATANQSRPKVVHVYSSQATDWDYSTGWYGDYVDQDVVYEMVDWGVKELTGTTDRTAAWHALIPDYSPGQSVAIKVNLNNCLDALDQDNIIDALIHPVNAVIRGLTEIGCDESDIWVYDAIRVIPERLQNGCAFPGVHFAGGDASNPQEFSDTEKVIFQTPDDVPALADQGICTVLVNADYLINMPIMKKHGDAWVSLSFKNHLGSIEKCDVLHRHIFPYDYNYRPGYSPLVDIYRNRHFGDKTILTIGDGLYGSRDRESSPPQPWITFDNQAPNSLFFSRDPVALDCVMYDFLDAEAGIPAGADDYLVLAAQEGFGVFEHRVPGISVPEQWYSLIDYTFLDLEQPIRLGVHCRDDAAYLSWSPHRYPAPAGYRTLFVSETGEPPNEGSSPIDLSDPDQLNTQLTGLTLYSLYEVWIEAFDAQGFALAESNHVLVLPTDKSLYIPMIHWSQSQ